MEGIDDIKLNVALCCKPIPGDRIVGYITKGNGISIHRSICPNISDELERLIDVSWNSDIKNKYSTNILVHALNNKNVLIDLISKTSSSDITVQSINTLDSKDEFLYEITILVENLEKLTKFINDLETLPNITFVERIIK